MIQHIIKFHKTQINFNPTTVFLLEHFQTFCRARYFQSQLIAQILHRRPLMEVGVPQSCYLITLNHIHQLVSPVSLLFKQMTSTLRGAFCVDQEILINLCHSSRPFSLQHEIPREIHQAQEKGWGGGSGGGVSCLKHSFVEPPRLGDYR